jgi:uncharacterized protein (TIGR00369 family)
MGDDFVERWIGESGYTRSLGVELASLSEESALLRLPFREENSNPGKALHGGCAASLAVVGGHAVARNALGETSGPWHTCVVQISYLAAAIDEDVTAEATLLRRGKELCFVEVDVRREDGKPIAHATSTVRGRFDETAAELVRSSGDDGATDPGKLGPGIGRMPYVAARGFTVEHMADGRSRISMPGSDANADAGGGSHEGAVLALLDTTGAMAAWAETGIGPYKASTPSLQARMLAPPPSGELVAYGRCIQRDREILWSDVEVADRASHLVFARGTVLYRIVT